MAAASSARLPRGWTTTVRAAVLHAVALANLLGRRSGDRSEAPRLRREVELQREELRLKDARWLRVAPHRRPHYAPVERMAILELKAARGWPLARTAAVFQVSEPTVASWLARLDEQGQQTLVRLGEPVNKFPQLVGYLVRRLRVLCPALGKRKLAAALARAGLHLGATTVARLLKQPPPQLDQPTTSKQEPSRAVTAAKPHDVWHVDLTVVPSGGGFWTTWLPWALPQRAPFGWWIAAVVDGCSRRVLQLAGFAEQPTSRAVQKLLERTLREVGARPQSIVCDRGVHFDCRVFRSFCKRRKIAIRYGAVGRHGSIALVERFIRTLKESLRKLPLIPLESRAFARELRLFQEWFNEHRPHEVLGGRTPQEVYERSYPAHRKPRYEPRSRWRKNFSCARPWALTRGSPGAELELTVAFLADRTQLPIVTLKRVT